VQHCKTRPCPKKCGRYTRACPEPCAADCSGHATHCPERRDGGLVLLPIKEKRHKTIWLAAEFVRVLGEHRDRQYIQRITADTEWVDYDLVSASGTGTRSPAP